jgi:hypothetical protein
LVAPVVGYFPWTPSPVRSTALGELPALLSTFSVPMRLPKAVGVNRTFTQQLVLGPMLAPQLVTIEKSPVVNMLETMTGVVLL